MRLFSWKNPPIAAPPVLQRYGHHRIQVEKNSERKELSLPEIENNLGILYVPQLDFQKQTDFFWISRKIARFHERGGLDRKQLWLGAYFQKEILTPAIPLVYLRWMDDAIGWGVFAMQDLKPMTYIGEYAGQVRRKCRSDSKNAYCFQYSIISGEPTRFTIDARNQGGLSRFINHSGTPNLASALATCQNLSHIILFTIRSIRQGEQLCYDYGPDYWAKRCKPKVL